jgi:5-methyltetrahydropteroyltriglutamate--homocysteine methyltransferase
LTSHAGALHRAGRVDDATGGEALSGAVDEVVAWQLDVGVDVPNDGELSKKSFFSYVKERLSGLVQVDESLWPVRKEDKLFPDYYRAFMENIPFDPDFVKLLVCEGPVEYVGREALEVDLANLNAALAKHGIEEGFYTALAPSGMEGLSRNEQYPSTEAYLEAVAEALRVEYETVAEAGVILQIDAPDIAAMYDWLDMPDRDTARRWIASRVEILNHALRNVPEEQIRIHVCWGSWPGPHTTDLPLRDWVDLLLTVKGLCYSLEAATVTHELDYEIWRDVKLPEGKLLMPGVVTHKTDAVEPAELVARRLLQYAEIVGRDNILAGTDCGMSRTWDPTLAAAKFRAMAEGARIASTKLWT